MDAESRAAAEQRLTEAAARLGLTDPRPPYRERLRALRESDPAAFQRAVDHYSGQVLPRLAVEEPLAVWLEYGTFLGSLTGAGRMLSVDGEGRAAPAEGAVGAGQLVLFVPDENGMDVLVATMPADPSAAQAATLTLLLERRLSL